MNDNSTVPTLTSRADDVATWARVRCGHTAVNTPDLDRFRRFYEDVLGLQLVVVHHPTGAPFRRLGAFTDRDARSMVLLAFEVPGYTSGLPEDVIGRRGRLDHLAFYAANDDEFHEVLERLVDAGACSGRVDDLGPVRSALFIDPDGAHHNLQTSQPGWQPDASVEVVDDELIARLMAEPSTGTDR
jgi:catechol 2,3-dioxygenase-like lactoylglutathione lyase family enzyme